MALPVCLERACVCGSRPLGVGPRGRLVGGPRAECAKRVVERPVGRLRGVREPAVERRDEDDRSAIRQRKPVAPQPQREPEAEVGGQDRIGAFAWQVRSRRGHSDHGDVEWLVECRRACIDTSEQGLYVCDRGRPAERSRRRQLARERGEEATANAARRNPEEHAHRGGSDPLERPAVVRVAVEGAGQRRGVQRQNRGNHRHAACERALERDRDPPALRRRSLEQRVRTRRAKRLGTRRRQQRGRAAVQQRLGGRDDHDRVGLDERRMDAERDAAVDG